MCDPITLIAAGVTVASSLLKGASSTAQASANASAAKKSANIHNAQLEKDKENARNQGQQAMNERHLAFLETRAANLAYVAASGGENISYMQAIAPQNQKALARDFAAIEGQTQGNVDAANTQIRVNRMNAKAAKSSVKYAAIGAAAGVAGSIAGAASGLYELDQKYSVPEA